jgi:hypothetical protein
MLFTANQRLLSSIDSVEDHAVQADVERLFHDPLGLIGFGRESREQRDIRLKIALLHNHGLVRHSHQEQVS